MHRDLNPTDHDFPDGGAPASGPPTMPAPRVIAIVLTALVLGALLNAEALLATAERQPFGTTRTVAVGLAQPLAEFSRTIRFTAPRSAIEELLRGDPGLVLAQPQPAPPTEAAGVGDPSPTPSATVPATAEVTPSPTPSPTPTERVITAADPLRVYVAGDSMVGQFGPAMQNLGEDTGVVTTEVRYEFSSGLTRPDFIDWPKEMVKVGRTLDPDVIVFFIGGNDPQPLKLDDVVYEPGEGPWVEEYRSRVSTFMQQLVDDGRRVYWVGMPIARDADYSERMAMLNGIYASEAEAHEAVTFVPSWDLFAGPDGRFSEYLPNAKGEVVDMRLNDGIHLTTAGAYRLARVVFDAIAADFGLPE